MKLLGMPTCAVVSVRLCHRVIFLLDSVYDAAAVQVEDLADEVEDGAVSLVVVALKFADGIGVQMGRPRMSSIASRHTEVLNPAAPDARKCATTGL
jgi:hypothetical protein